MHNVLGRILKACAFTMSAAATFAVSSTASAGLIYRIDIDSTYDNASIPTEVPVTTEAGWTSLNVGSGGGPNGRNVTVGGVTFSVFSAIGSRSRSTAASDLTRDFIYDDGAGAEVGLTVAGLTDGLWEASVYSFDAVWAAGPQAVGITQFGPPEIIYASDFAPSATTPLMFQFDSSSLLDGFGIFTRAATSVNRARFNALELRQIAQDVPAPSGLVLIASGLLGLSLARRRR
jgi:hypothetical protein